MKVKKLTFWAAFVVGGLVLYPWSKRKKGEANSSITEGQPESYFAFINDPNGEPIYENQGSDVIVRLPNKTYVGAITGEPDNGFLPVQIEIDKVKYNAWVRAGKLTIIEGQEKARNYRIEKGLDKTVPMQRTIQRYFT